MTAITSGASIDYLGAMIIAVALSPTPAGQAALDLALRECVLRDAELVVINIVDTAEHAADGSARDEVAAGLAEHVDRVEGAKGVTTRIATEATRGDVAGAILDLAGAEGADLLVIGSRRRTPVGKLIMGSTVQRVLLDASVPVLVTKG